MKRLLKIVLWIFAGLIGIVLLTGLFTQTGLFKSYLKDLAVDELNKLIEGKVSIDEIRGNLFSNLEVHDLSIILDNDTLLFLPEMNLSYDLFALLNDHIRIHQFEIIRPKFNLEKDSSGTWNVARLMSPDLETETITSETEEPFGFTISLDSFLFDDGTFNLKTDEPHIPGQVYHLDINLKGLYSEDEIQLVLDSLSFQTVHP